MKLASSRPAMIALAAVLSAPAIVAAQNATAPAPARPAAMAPAAVPATTAPVVAADSKSTYVTADQHVRSSKIVGASLYNERDEKVGSIDDVLIAGNSEISGVVISVGGFLGIASKLVEVPYSRIQVANNRLVIAGATKDQLTNLPEYKYAAGS